MEQTCVAIKIIDINDNAPIFSPQNYTVVLAESSKITQLVTHVFATDKDSGNNGKVLYRFKSGNNDNKFIIDSSTGIITLANQLDYETMQSYTLEIRGFRFSSKYIIS